EEIVRMGGNGEPAAMMNNVADFARRFSFQKRQFGADAKEMPVGGCDFDAGQNEKPVNRLAINAHQTFFEHVSDGVTRVVIGHRDSMQTCCCWVLVVWGGCVGGGCGWGGCGVGGVVGGWGGCVGGGGGVGGWGASTSGSD